ncbi:MAG: hypothetical protein AB7N71_03985 [Phycisphaerae bacterium]
MNTRFPQSLCRLAVVGYFAVVALSAQVLSSSSSELSIAANRIAPPSVSRLASLPESPPPNRGFRVEFADPDDTWPFELPGESESEAMRRAAEYVAKHLATDGLLRTTLQALQMLGAESFAADADPAWMRLRDVGIPVDLLAYFQNADMNSDENARRVGTSWRSRAVENLKRLLQIAAKTDAQAASEAIQKWEFVFTPSEPTFRVFAESGQHDLAMLRLQLTRGDYWRGPGAGGGTDIARQISTALPDTPLTISIEDRFLEDFKKTVATWPARDPKQMLVIPESARISQWAQDNAKAGRIGTAPESRIATIVPRYASHSETRSVYVPGDTAIWFQLRENGHTLISSPLLFQGGNLLAVDDPVTNRRVLLIGEAEIYRNIALGLREDQVRTAFQIEFGVDEVVTVPAVSFHLDLDVTFRRQGDELVAYVNDVHAAAAAILFLGIGPLVNAGVISEDVAQQAAEAIQLHNLQGYFDLIVPAVQKQASGTGQFAMSLAEHFAVSAVDNPIGNFQRFLLALDYKMNLQMSPNLPFPDRVNAAYIRSFHRLERDRAALHRILDQRGWKVVPIPSFAMAERSINYLNGIQSRNRYLMPAYGGLFAPLDEQVRSILKREMGDDVEIIPILCGESQCRVGGVHCSVAAYYQLSEN